MDRSNRRGAPWGALVLVLLLWGCDGSSRPTSTPTSSSGPEALLPGGDLSQQKPHYRIRGGIPPAPVLSPQEELQTFKLPTGYHIQLVAAEPLVDKPVALTFDPEGRIYVVEMCNYMRDLSGSGELEPGCRISLLEDSRGGGQPDRKTVVLDGLVLPRAVALAGPGVLVAEPPQLWYCRPGRPKQLVLNDFGSRTANPEHIANGLSWNLDNWYYNANWPGRLRFREGRWERQLFASRGQWGITHDDIGRLFFNTSTAMLLCDWAPSQYFGRNPYLQAPAGMNAAPVDSRVAPGRVNPGVNRGYTEDLDEQGKLQRATAACGPCIFFGDRLPEEARGNAFVCEPAGNLVARYALSENGLEIKGRSLRHQGRDFLTSTDERFRPVNLYTAPDGTLYLVDFYHGVIEHKSYLSAYVTDQIKQRNLDQGGAYGRIWRVYHDSARPGPQPRLARASSSELVGYLSHPNGWWRDTAQRLLVERHDPATLPLLESLVLRGKAPLARVHALWALQGMDRLSDELAATASQDRDPRVRLAALQAAAPGPQIQRAARQRAQDPDARVRLQVMLLETTPWEPVGRNILRDSMALPVFRHAALNRMFGHEFGLLRTALNVPDFRRAEGRTELLEELAECISRARDPQRLQQLLQLASRSDANVQEALLRGMVRAVSPDPKARVSPRPLRLPSPPDGLQALLSRPAAHPLATALSWPGKPGEAEGQQLSSDQLKLFQQGQVFFERVCAVCHQPSGLGQPGTAPRLVDSPWAVGPPERLIRIALDGFRGPTKEGGKDSGMDMPSLAALNDQELAAVLTYVRHAWGHESSAVEPELVQAVRAQTRQHRGRQWTREELIRP
ncbi:c-type cytochrome [bacterium]|nr:c-type cytochrome [bacterium]